jgi:hypothetical protein
MARTATRVATRQTLDTSEVIARLRLRYADDGYAMLTEVGDGTGAKLSRWADAIVMSLWPSRGLELHGFEVKVSRSDWVKELQDPSKAEAVCKYCDRWWVVVGDETIVKPGELPKTWGLLVPFGDGLKVAVSAPELAPIAFDRAFVAAIMRRATQQAFGAGELKEIGRREYARGHLAGRESGESSIRNARSELESLRRDVHRFEAATGLTVENCFSVDDLAKRIARAKAGIDCERSFERMESLAAQVLHVLKEFKPIPTEGE